jgi:dihydrofolate synthase / folylpolyglutamate synthase
VLDKLFALETFGIKLGLDNITRLCAALNHPERSFATIHVAGTNGKGSVTAMVHAALVAAGIRSARYTSPHLMSLTERFVIGEGPVAESTLEEVGTDVLALADRLRENGTLSVTPTFFEVTTAIGFELFRRAGVEVAVIEVGLGGRFDATNVIQPIAGAITTIAFDHQQHLGNTLAQIAFEKAGIIKQNMTVVAGTLPPDALRVVRNASLDRGATLIETADAPLGVEMLDGRARITVETPNAIYGPLPLALRGEHQAANAVVAIRLLEAAQANGFPVDRAAIERGLSSAEWHARLELLTLPGGKRVLLDAAHNAEGAIALASYLRTWHPERPTLVIGIMRDKDVDEILRPLLPCVSRVIATAAPTPRALPAADLAQRIGRTTNVIAEPHEAIEHALQMSNTVCVAGSIFLAGAVRDSLKQRAILQ